MTSGPFVSAGQPQMSTVGGGFLPFGVRRTNTPAAQPTPAAPTGPSVTEQFMQKMRAPANYVAPVAPTKAPIANMPTSVPGGAPQGPFAQLSGMSFARPPVTSAAPAQARMPGNVQINPTPLLNGAR